MAFHRLKQGGTLITFGLNVLTNMRNIITHKKVFLMILLTVFMVFGVQNVSHSFFWEILEIFGWIFPGGGGGGGGSDNTSNRKTDGITNIRAFPDGRLVAMTASERIDLWLPYSERHHFTLRHNAHIRDISVNHDGSLLASGAMNGTIRIWNPHTLIRETVFETDTDVGILSVAFNPEGSLLASGSADGTIRLWDPHSQTLEATISGFTNSAILSVAFNPNGSLLASGSVDGKIHLWNPHTQTSQTTIIAHTDSVLDLAFSPDGSLLASASADGTMGLWNPQTAQNEAKLDHASPVLSIAFKPDGSLLVSGCVDGTVRLWEPHTGQIQNTLRNESPIRCVDYAPDGNTLFSGSQDGKVRKWDVTTEQVSISAFVPSPLTEETLHGSVITLTLSNGIFEQSTIDIKDAVSVSGISGATILWNDLNRQSNTEITVKLAFNGDMTTDGKLTFNVGAGAIAQYDGPVITATISVYDTGTTPPTNSAPVFTEGSSTSRSIAEHKAAGVNIGSAISATDTDNDSLTYILSGTDVSSFNIDSSSGQMQTSAILDYETKTTYSVTVSVLDGNGGSDSITVTINVTDVNETPINTDGTLSISVSADISLTEATLHGNVITVTLRGGVFETAFWDYQKVSVSGIADVTFDDFFDVDRESATQLTIELTFNGNMTFNGTLTFTVDAGAIQNYDGSALTAQIGVSAVTESISVSPSTLTEETLDTTEITITLNGRKYERFIFDIRDSVSVSGITGVTIPWHDPDRESDAEITTELEFDGDMNTDGTLTFTVGADAIAGYNGPALTAQVSVTASRENALGANFPNPFNPETWIPYQLGKPTKVTISIYNVKGQLVRTLAIGHQAVGMYQNRSRAAYWDGKNEFGEKVASGLYFYTLTAGDFTATRKMLIRK